MGNSRKLWRLGLLIAACGIARTARADEIRLKDGKKLYGVIVAYEDNMFRVKTDFGYVLVEKDKIASIIPSTPAQPKPEAKTDAKPQPATAAPASAGNAAAGASAAKPADQPEAPPKELEPPPNREEIQGNSYINYTYAFRMYKAPGWNVLEDARRALPNAIVAMGTANGSTVMVVGLEKTKDPLDAAAATVERRLYEAYENFRRLELRKLQVGGLPAVQYRYRGHEGDHDWSGRLVVVARGKEVFTVLGVTYADDDLIQIQENVIARAIASLDFSAH